MLCIGQRRDNVISFAAVSRRSRHLVPSRTSYQIFLKYLLTTQNPPCESCLLFKPPLLPPEHLILFKSGILILPHTAHRFEVHHCTKFKNLRSQTNQPKTFSSIHRQNGRNRCSQHHEVSPFIPPSLSLSAYIFLSLIPYHTRQPHSLS